MGLKIVFRQLVPFNTRQFLNNSPTYSRTASNPVMKGPTSAISAPLVSLTIFFPSSAFNTHLNEYLLEKLWAILQHSHQTNNLSRPTDAATVGQGEHRWLLALAFPGLSHYSDHFKPHTSSIFRNMARTDRPTDGLTHPLIEMRSRI